MEKNDENFGSVDLFYEKFYRPIIFGRGFSLKAVARTHYMMEKKFKGKHYGQVLEIGGGNGEHLEFILHSYKKYYLTDIRKPVLDDKYLLDPRIISQIANAEKLPFEDDFFDRIIVTCLLHHVIQPEQVLNEIVRVLRPTGVATIFLSCDPGLAVRVLRELTTAKIAKKSGFEGYKLMNARDHRNHVGSLLSLAKFAFRNRKFKIRYFPWRLPSWNLNGYIIVEVSELLPRAKYPDDHF